MTTTAHPRTVVTISTPADAVSAVPFLLGFTPTESVVMVTTGGLHAFHARIDLPGTPEDTAAAIKALLAPSQREQVTTALFIVYAADTGAGERIGTDFAGDFHAAGIKVPDVIVVTGQVARSTCGGGTWTVASAEEDTTATATTLRAAGRAPLSRREDVAALVAPGAELIEARAIRSARPRSTFDVDRIVSRQCEPGAAPLAEPEAAFLLAAFASDGAHRDVTLARDPHTLLPLLLDLTRRAPMAYAAHPASLAAFAAWMTGDGALAWCAVDRAREADPNNNLADLVAHALEAAVPPPPAGAFAA